MVSCCLTAACYLFFCLEASPRACFVLPGTFNWQLQLAAFTRLPQLFLLNVLRHHFDDFCYLLLIIFSFPPLDIFLINWHIQKQRHSYYRSFSGQNYHLFPHASFHHSAEPLQTLQAPRLALNHHMLQHYHSHQKRVRKLRFN